MDGKETKLIAFTGLDGSGKTSVIDGFQSYLSDSGISSAVLKNSLIANNPIVESLVASRKQFDATGEYIPAELDVYMRTVQFLTLARKILPELLEGTDIVLADRYNLCNIIYGRMVGGIGGRTAEQMLLLATDIRQPDATIYLDIDATTAFQRVLSLGKVLSWKEKIEKLEEAHNIYDVFLHQQNNVHRFDASRPLQEVLDSVIECYRSGTMFAATT